MSTVEWYHGRPRLIALQDRAIGTDISPSTPYSLSHAVPQFSNTFLRPSFRARNCFAIPGRCLSLSLTWDISNIIIHFSPLFFGFLVFMPGNPVRLNSNVPSNDVSRLARVKLDRVSAAFSKRDVRLFMSLKQFPRRSVSRIFPSFVNDFCERRHADLEISRIFRAFLRACV